MRHPAGALDRPGVPVCWSADHFSDHLSVLRALPERCLGRVRYNSCLEPISTESPKSRPANTVFHEEMKSTSSF